MAKKRTPLVSERIYVKVYSDFDATGYMSPKTIIWSDGRKFDIEQVKDYRPAARVSNGHTGDCYTVVIRGEEKYLYFERHLDACSSRIGRWYVESVKEQD